MILKSPGFNNFTQGVEYILKSLKDLYIAAKNSYEESAAVKAYTNQIDSYLESHPDLYFSNLQYVIESSYGLETFVPFIERYGIPFQGISTVKDCLAQCKNKCKWSGKDDSSYTEAEEFLEDYIHAHKNSYIMYEAFEDDLDERYIEAYYKNFPKIKNGKVNISPLLERYGNGCIPDLLVYTEADRSILESIYDNELPSAKEKRIQNQWIADSLKDFSNIDNDIQDIFTKESLEYKVEEKRRENEQFYRESMLLGETENSYAYTEENIQNIEDLISYKEYRLIAMTSDEKDTSNSNKNESVEDIQNYIYSLYEELSPMITEETADSVVPNLPQANTVPKENPPVVDDKDVKKIFGDSENKENNPEENLNESLFDSNTNNKKTGGMPDYLKNNHDMSYGEDDDSEKENISSDDYKKSKKEDPDKLDAITPYSYVDDEEPSNDYEDKKSSSDNSISSTPTSSPNGSIYNYYYNYNNSNNTTTSHTNTNSFNKHHSIKDDHSSHVRDNHSINKSIDDHSKYKRANLYPNHKEEEEVKESFDFSLNLPSYMEEVGDVDDMKPESDHPIQDTLHDIDRNITAKQQAAKKTVQSVANTGKLLMRPFTRTAEWVNNMINNWKDKSENAIKEKMADPHQRSSLFSAIKKAIIAGSLYKAGLLLNPVLIFLAIAKKWNDHSKMGRLRNEMIGELKTELAIIDEKFRDADRNGDTKAKYQLMRFKNELSKKLIRVGGTPNMRKII